MTKGLPVEALYSEIPTVSSQALFPLCVNGMLL